MSIIDKLGFALSVWAFFLSACNPFFQDKTLKYLAIACALGATLCFVLS